MQQAVETFKLGMRRLAAGVCVITTRSPAGERMGATATAVCSVSAAPPTLLCCLNRSSGSSAAIRSNGAFAVNVLAMPDRAIADRFAQPAGTDKFGTGEWKEGVTGAPVLASALASFDCRLSQAVDVGSHGVLFGTIMDVFVRTTDAEPLLYAAGGYGWFETLGSAMRLEADLGLRLRAGYAFPGADSGDEWR